MIYILLNPSFQLSSIGHYNIIERQFASAIVITALCSFWHGEAIRSRLFEPALVDCLIGYLILKMMFIMVS